VTCTDFTSAISEAPVVQFNVIKGATSMLLCPANDNEPERLAAGSATA
jgi:hypothetical protein